MLELRKQDLVFESLGDNFVSVNGTIVSVWSLADEQVSAAYLDGSLT